MKLILCVFFILLAFPLLGFSQETDIKQTHYPFPHSLNSAMGIPDPVRSYNIRLNTFRQQNDSTSVYDVGGHVGYGLFKWGGIHLRSLGIRTNPLLEVIAMVGLWRNQEQTQGISLLGIVGIPTGVKSAGANNNGHNHGLAYLLGITGRIAKHNVFTNDIILHYDFSAMHFIAENGTVIKLTKSLFITLDFRGTFGTSNTEITILPSLKWKLKNMGFIGLGFQMPLTKTASFRNQIILQLEFGNH